MSRVDPVIELVEIEAAHATALAELIEALDYPCSVVEAGERIDEVIADPSQQLFVAMFDGKPAGLLGLQLMYSLPLGRRTCRITALVVHESFRRKGLARQLLREAEHRARTAGAARIEVSAGEQRTSGHELYRQCGYRSGSVRFVKPLSDA